MKIPTLTTGDLSIYIHIPFCTRKCPYCNFFVLPNDSTLHSPFLKGLKKEWELIQPAIHNQKIVSVYFGGGTPSLLSPEAIQQILEPMTLAKDVEITLEANPESVSLEKMRAFHDHGINRISLGLQSLDEGLLKILGRGHSAQQGIQAINSIVTAGITNLSVDVMYEIPHQTVKTWQTTLDQLRHLPITHASLYNLTFEKGSVFHKKQKQLSSFLPSPEEGTSMLMAAIQNFTQMGLNRYELSAFARPGFEAIHNSRYWTSSPFMGLGPSAWSFYHGERSRNVCNLTKYLALVENGVIPRDFEEKLSPLASLHERFAIRLRLMQGAPRGEFPIEPSLLNLLERKGWISLTPTSIVLTEEGKLWYDSVAEEIVVT